MRVFGNFRDADDWVRDLLRYRAHRINAGKWQGMNVSGKPEMDHFEVLNLSFSFPMPATVEKAQADIRPHLPWAEDHFQERVFGEPLNPGEQYKNWPFYKHRPENDRFRTEGEGPLVSPQAWAYLAGLLDGEGTIYRNPKRRGYRVMVYQKDPMVLHRLVDLFGVGMVKKRDGGTKVLNGREYNNVTYFWQVNKRVEVVWLLSNLLPYLVIKRESAREALEFISQLTPSPKGNPPADTLWGRSWEPRFTHTYMSRYWPKFDNGEKLRGMMYEAGDLNDLVNLLRAEPFTRQAYLPVWFPEDTGVVHGGRVPCTLGYHFILRGGYLHTTYYIRSCDYLRHFKDDVYMTVRLAQWVHERLQDHPVWKEAQLGRLIFHCVSMHMFAADRKALGWDKEV